MTHVLIVEDERIVATELERTLSKAGYQVSGLASSSSEAIALASSRAPDLVLMDIHIEGQRDGIATGRIMRERFHVPVVYLTAVADESTVRRASETEPFGYLVRPFSDEQLRSTIEIALFKHHMESRLAERERWYSATLRAIADGVIASDHTGRVTFMNAAAEAITGLRADGVTGQPLTNVLRVIDDRSQGDGPAPIERVRSLGRVVHLPANISLARRGPSHVPIDDSAAPIVDDAGNALGEVTVFRDVTEQRRLQDQLAMADRLAALAIFSAGIAHEISNPLTAVTVYADDAVAALAALAAELASGRIPADLGRRVGELAEGAAQVREGAERIARIVRDVNVFARPGSGRHASVDVRRTLEWAVRVALQPYEKQLRLVATFEPAPPVEADEAKLAQAFINILTNAAQAFPPGSETRNEITVSTRTDTQGNAVVAIADTGPGIPPEHLKHIFEPFFTTREVGSGIGLGLSVAHGIVKALGGEIRARSALGKGTVFELTLPPHPPADASQGRAERPAHQQARILVIEEQSRRLEWLKRTLGREHHVEGLTSARAALRLLQAGGTFDLILCGIASSDMTGMDFYEGLRSFAAEMCPRVVFTTEGTCSEPANAFLAANGNPRLDEPYSSDSARALVRRLLGADAEV